MPNNKKLKLVSNLQHLVPIHNLSLGNVKGWIEPLSKYELKDDEIHVWQLNLCNDLFTEIELYSTYLSNDEMEMANRYKFDDLRKCYIVRRYFLRYLLSKYLNCDIAGIRFDYNTYGKPFIKGVEIHFNMSYSRDIVLFAFNWIHEIGIDIEFLNSDFSNLDIARHFFTIKESNELEKLDAIDFFSAFYTCWTRKEAYLKSKGKGLSILMNSFAINSLTFPKTTLLFSELFPEDVNSYIFFSFFPGEGYLASIAVRNQHATFFK